MTDSSEQLPFKPDGWHTVTPRIVASDARELVRFVRDVFGATGEYQPDVPAIMRIGESMIMISDADARDAANAFLYVYVPNTDETHRRAVQAGARSIEEPVDLPYGDRRAMVKDRWGNSWQIATRLKPAPA